MSTIAGLPIGFTFSTLLQVDLHMRIIALKLTRRYINRRHICFNIKSFSVHPLLWIYVMLDFIHIGFAELSATGI